MWQRRLTTAPEASECLPVCLPDVCKDIFRLSLFLQCWANTPGAHTSGGGFTLKPHPAVKKFPKFREQEQTGPLNTDPQEDASGPGRG